MGDALARDSCTATSDKTPEALQDGEATSGCKLKAGSHLATSPSAQLLLSLGAYLTAHWLGPDSSKSASESATSTSPRLACLMVRYAAGGVI